jgi:hypothetical protein
MPIVCRTLFVALCALVLARAAWGADDSSVSPQAVVAGEAVKLQQMKDVASRTGDILTIRAASGKEVVWRNENQCGEGGQPFSYEHCIHFVFADHLVKSHGFVVLALTYEGYSYDWVDDSTGALTHLPEEPHPSPSADRLAVVGGSEAEGYDGIQVWRRQNDSFVLEWEHEPTGYALYDFKGWQGDDIVLLSVTTWVNHAFAEGRPARAIRQREWKYEGPAEASK